MMIKVISKKKNQVICKQMRVSLQIFCKKQLIKEKTYFTGMAPIPIQFMLVLFSNRQKYHAILNMTRITADTVTL